MKKIADSFKILQDLGIPKEDIANILPLGMTSKMILRTNLRNLIDMSRKRLCTRAYWEFREFMKDLMKALSEYSEEWQQIADWLFVPYCERYKFMNNDFCFCTESKCCGRHPNINELKIVKK